MVTGLDAGRWNARGLVLVPRIPQAQVRREGLPPTRLRRVPIGKQRRMPRQSPAWRKLRSREGSTYIVDYIIPVWGTSAYHPSEILAAWKVDVVRGLRL